MATALASPEAATRRWKLRLPDRLPALSKPVLSIYRLAWIAFACLAAVALVLAYPYERKQQAQASEIYAAGLIATRADATHRFVDPFSSEARAKGIAGGETLLRVDGKTVSPDDERVAQLLAGPDGGHVTVTVKSPGGDVRDVTLTRSSSYLRDAYKGTGLTFAARRWIEFGVSTAATLLMLAASALLFLRRPRDPVAALLAMAMVVNVANPSSLGGHTFQLLAVFTFPLSLLLFMSGLLVFPDGRFAVRWWPVLAAAMILAQSTSIIGHWNLAISTAGDRLSLAVTMVVVAAVGLRYLKAPAGMLRQQMKFAVLGFVAVVFFAVIAQLLSIGLAAAPSEGVRAWMILLRNIAASLTGLASAAGLLVALLRYRLYDADAVIGRSAAYGVLTVGFVALFAGSEKLIELSGQEYLGQNLGSVAGGVAAALAAVVIAPLHARIHRWAERRFQKPLYRLRHVLPALVGDLRETAGLEQIAGATLDSLVAGVRTSRAALIAREQLIDARDIQAQAVKDWCRTWTPTPKDGIETDASDPLFPIRVPLEAEGHGRVGWLLLGPRPDGSLFGKSECDAIEEIAEPVARAIKVALRRREREQQIDARLQRMERKLAELARTAMSRSAPSAPA